MSMTIPTTTYATRLFNAMSMFAEAKGMPFEPRTMNDVFRRFIETAARVATEYGQPYGNEKQLIDFAIRLSEYEKDKQKALGQGMPRLQSRL